MSRQAQQEAEAKLIQARAQRESASILAEASQARRNRRSWTTVVNRGALMTEGGWWW